LDEFILDQIPYIDSAGLAGQVRNIGTVLPDVKKAKFDELDRRRRGDQRYRIPEASIDERTGRGLSRARIVKASSWGAVEEAAQIICNGGLVAFPTETVYGLGADACNPAAVARVFEVKRRPSFDPIILHIAGVESTSVYGIVPEGRADDLMARLWPGPLTLVVQKTAIVPAIVTAGLDTVALRVPSHPAALALIRAADRAIAAPSANLFGHVSPTEAQHVADQLADSVDLILDGGRCEVGIESTIVSLVEDPPRILRAGGIPIEEIEALLGPVARFTGSSDRPEAPGQLTRHYATRTPLVLLDERQPAGPPAARTGLLSFRCPPNAAQYAAVEVLSESGDLREAAANLFAALRRLDSLGLESIVACPCPERDLGIAIMDRLRRCAAR
jgi:L-threonylcarbamoyladenylate synthase